MNKLTKLYRDNKAMHTSIATDDSLFKKKYTPIVIHKL